MIDLLVKPIDLLIEPRHAFGDELNLFFEPFGDETEVALDFPDVFGIHRRPREI
jgi:hypothetical protein